jgi:hypothetical protein
MAIRPRDRYQNVADFASDLKKVTTALPAPVAPAPQRPIDPHSTQPDLPMLYEALQAAKENKANTTDSSTSPIGSPAMSPTRETCPRCHAPLSSSAAYCPQCGTSLTNLDKNNKPYAHIQALDISAEDTALVRPQAQVQKVIANQKRRPTIPDTPAPHAASSMVNTTGPQHASRLGSTATQVPPVSQPMQKSSSAQSVQQSSSDDSSPSQSLFATIPPRMKILISAMAVFIVLLVILMLFLLHHNH